VTNDYSILNVQFVSRHIIDLLHGLRIVVNAKCFSVKIIASLLGAFAVFRKATIGFVMSFRLSFCSSLRPSVRM